METAVLIITARGSEGRFITRFNPNVPLPYSLKQFFRKHKKTKGFFFSNQIIGNCHSLALCLPHCNLLFQVSFDFKIYV